MPHFISYDLRGFQLSLKGGNSSVSGSQLLGTRSSLLRNHGGSLSLQEVDGSADCLPLGFDPVELVVAELRPKRPEPVERRQRTHSVNRKIGRKIDSNSHTFGGGGKLSGSRLGRKSLASAIDCSVSRSSTGCKLADTGFELSGGNTSSICCGVSRAGSVVGTGMRASGALDSLWIDVDPLSVAEIFHWALCSRDGGGVLGDDAACDRLDLSFSRVLRRACPCRDLRCVVAWLPRRWCRCARAGEYGVSRTVVGHCELSCLGGDAPAAKALSRNVAAARMVHEILLMAAPVL